MAIDLQERDVRQRELVPPEKLAACHAIVVGVGAVGRQAALQLAAMGILEMTLIDFDQVDVVNLAPQGYMAEDCGKAKVEATGAVCLRLNPAIHVHSMNERFRRSSARIFASATQNGRQLVLFCCVDSISTRAIVWEAMKAQVSFFADARMSGEVLRVLVAELPAGNTQYASTLFSQEEAHVGSCTAKSTIYTASIGAGLMLSQFTRWLRGLPVDQDVLLNLLSSELTVV